MSPKYLPLLAALALAGPAQAISFNVTDFTFGEPADVIMSGSEGSPSYSGPAGEFSADVILPQPSNDGSPELFSSRAAAAAAPTSFMAWCAELTQSFSFGVNYSYDERSGGSYFGDRRNTDLSRLFTAAQGFVVDSGTSAAMQAAIWEIIYEGGSSYGLASGTFLGEPALAGDATAFHTVDGFLAHLSSYRPDYQLTILTDPDHQDFLVASNIPEPEIWALLVAGLAAVAALKRRRESEQPASEAC